MSRFPTTRDGAPRVRYQVLAVSTSGRHELVLDVFPTRHEAQLEAEALAREHAIRVSTPYITFTTKRIER